MRVWGPGVLGPWGLVMGASVSPRTSLGQSILFGEKGVGCLVTSEALRRGTLWSSPPVSPHDVSLSAIHCPVFPPWPPMISLEENV